MSCSSWGLRWPWFSSGSRPWFCLKTHSDSKNHTDRCNETHSSTTSHLSLHQRTCMQKRVEKLTLKHTLQFSVWLTHSPHKMHLHGAKSVSLEETCSKALKSRELRSLLVLRLLNTMVSTSWTGCRFCQSQRKIWMNAEFEEWLDWDQHLQRKQILYKSQQKRIFLPCQSNYKALVPSVLL